jgi:divalent metal cation (Fe/Co/Zn/Cd) transporter
VSGALTFFILLAPLSELDATRPDNTAGMALVGLAAAVFLFWLRRKVRRRLSDKSLVAHGS